MCVDSILPLVLFYIRLYTVYACYKKWPTCSKLVENCLCYMHMGHCWWYGHVMRRTLRMKEGNGNESTGEKEERKT